MEYNIKRALQWLQVGSISNPDLYGAFQYAAVKISTANFVFLDVVPNCLVHVAVEALQLETYRDRKGYGAALAHSYTPAFSFQAEVSYKLLQAKLLHRNAARATTLAEVSVAGSASTDFVDRSGKLKKLAIRLSNPRITLTDGWPRTRTYMNYYFRSA